MANACRIYRQAFSLDMKKPRFGGAFSWGHELSC